MAISKTRKSEADVTQDVFRPLYHTGTTPILPQQLEPHVPVTQLVALTPEVKSELDIRVCTRPVLQPSHDEVVVRILYSGICRSDVCFSVGPLAGFPSHDHIAGHEGIGNVVKSHDPDLLGCLVGLRYLGTSCKSCYYCLHGLCTSCPSQRNLPKHITGTFQQYATVPVSCLIPLPVNPDTNPSSLATYTTALCSGSTALRALKEADVRAGGVIVVVGVAGAIGQLTGAIAKQIVGLKVIGIDLRRKIKSLTDSAATYGDVFIEAPDSNSHATWREFQATCLKACEQLRPPSDLSRGADAAIIASSSIEGFKNLDGYVCDGARIVCVGVPQGGHKVSLPVNALIERNLRLSGTLMGGDDEALEVLSFLVSGRLKTPYPTEIRLEDVPDYLKRAAEDNTLGKTVVKINDPLVGAYPTARTDKLIPASGSTF